MLRPFWFANITYGFLANTGFLWAGDSVPRWADVRSGTFQDVVFAQMNRAFTELRRLTEQVDAFDVGLPVNRDLSANSFVQGLTRVAKGDLESAEPFLRRELAYQTRDLEDRRAFITKYRRKGSKPWQRDMEILAARERARDNNLLLIDRVRARDRGGAADLLRGRERLYVQAWKAERHWISSPFPLEVDEGC